jgi:hypothetical protein
MSRTGQMLRQCLTCESCLPAITTITDHRCAFEHRNGIATPNAAYPSVDWMRSAAAVCGPNARVRVPLNEAEGYAAGATRALANAVGIGVVKPDLLQDDRETLVQAALRSQGPHQTTPRHSLPPIHAGPYP